MSMKPRQPGIFKRDFVNLPTRTGATHHDGASCVQAVNEIDLTATSCSSHGWCWATRASNLERAGDVTQGELCPDRHHGEARLLQRLGRAVPAAAHVVDEAVDEGPCT